MRQLSPRRQEILELVARGLDDGQIADTLGISLQTVRNQISHMLAHYEVQNRTAAVIKAVLLGDIALPSMDEIVERPRES